MPMEEISLKRFREEIANDAKYNVDINALLGLCGASPIRIYYKTDVIIVTDIFPESILLVSGDNYISINQIIKIYKGENSDGAVSYAIVCGELEALRISVIITQQKN